MIFKQIDHFTLIAELTHSEMNETGLAFATQQEDHDYAIEIVGFVLQQAKREIGYEPHTREMTIEILPNESKGCKIYFTCIPPYRLLQGMPVGVGQPLIYFFHDFEEMLSAAIALFRSFPDRIYQTSLYQSISAYYLTVSCLASSEALCRSFLSDFGQWVSTGDIAAAAVAEYLPTIIKNNAIDKLAYYFYPSTDALRSADTPCS